MDICLYHVEIGTCPLSFARMARTFTKKPHKVKGLLRSLVRYFAGAPNFI